MIGRDGDGVVSHGKVAAVSFEPYTVVVPAFNVERTLPDTLRSLCAQSLPPAAIVVADDSSTDSTGEIARITADVSWRSYPHSGLAGVQNRALTEVFTPLVAFVDADDLWHPRAAEALVAQFEDPEVAAASVAAVWFWSDDAPDLVRHPGPEGASWRRAHRRELLHENWLTKSGTMFRCAAVQSVGGYDESLTSCEDLELVLRLVEGGYRVSHTAWRGVAYRQAADTMSRNAARMIENEVKVVIGRLSDEHGVASAEVHDRIRRMWLRNAARLASAGDDLTSLPSLESLQPQPSLGDRALDRLAYGPLAGTLTVGWRGVRAVRGVIAPRMRFT